MWIYMSTAKYVEFLQTWLNEDALLEFSGQSFVEKAELIFFFVYSSLTN